MAPRRTAGDEGEEEEVAQGCGAFELPYFGNATSVTLDLGFLSLTEPPADVFAGLTELRLFHLRFHGPCELGDAVSSPRCPCLQKLKIHEARGLDNLTIHSESLLLVELNDLTGATTRDGLEQLTIVAPCLEELVVEYRFYYGRKNQPVASISAPRLVSLHWRDLYDPVSVHLGEMEHLQWLATLFFQVYGHGDSTHNHDCLRLLQHLKVINGLMLPLSYPREIDNNQFMMEDMAVLPDITLLHLIVFANGHAIGASVLHVLKMCSGIRRLMLEMQDLADSKEQTACRSGCICGQQLYWMVEKLLLNHVQEVEITKLRWSEHDVVLVKRLFSWTTVLKKMTITFDFSVTEMMAKELCRMLRSFSRPEISMEFYMYEEDMTKVFLPKNKPLNVIF